MNDSMIPVYVHDVVINEEEETYLVLLKSDLNLDGAMPINIGPLPALNLAQKIEESRDEAYDSQNLIPELLEETGTDLDAIKVFRDERGRYRARIKGDPEKTEGKETYLIELTDALALAAETNTRLEIPPQLLQTLKGEASPSEKNAELLEAISALRFELQDALETEDYERAETLKQQLHGKVRQLEQSLDLDDDIEEELRRAYRDGNQR